MAIGLVAVLVTRVRLRVEHPAPRRRRDNTAIASGNSRIKFKDEYKQMLGKDGKMLFKPSESKKKPAGVQ